VANYGTIVLTNQGLTLFAKAQAGIQLNFTRMQIGSGQLSVGQNPESLTALITPISYFAINMTSSSVNTAHVKGIFENTAISAPTYSCELGLFAQDPDDGEILYAYANAGLEGDTIPPISAGPISKQYQVNTAIGNASNVTATIPAETYIATSQKGIADGVASLGPDGVVPADQLAFSGGNQEVVKVSATILEIDTRSNPMTYTSGKLTKVEEKDGSTVVKTNTLNYSGSRLDTVVEVADGTTATSTLVYDGSGNLIDVTRAVL
jgi:hypothetical protein